MQVILGDRLVPAEEARVPVADRGFLYGDSLFETVPLYGGRLFRLGRHLERFLSGCELLGIAPVAADAITRRLERLIEAEGAADGIMRFMLTRGIGGRGLDPAGARDQTFLATLSPPRLPAPTLWREGAAVIVSSVPKTPAACLPSGVKTGNYLNNILAFREAAAAGAQEAVMLTLGGDVAEGSFSNLFLVANGSLVTPPLEAGVLGGVARELVIEAAALVGVPVSEEPVPRSVLARAEEAFYTNSVVVIAPVGSMDGAAVRAPGPVTLRLRDACAALIAGEAGHPWSFGPPGP